MTSVETVRGPVDLGDLGQSLLAAGVTKEQIDTMLVDNPVRYFTPAAGRDGAA